MQYNPGFNVSSPPVKTIWYRRQEKFHRRFRIRFGSPEQFGAGILQRASGKTSGTSWGAGLTWVMFPVKIAHIADIPFGDVHGEFIPIPGQTAVGENPSAIDLDDAASIEDHTVLVTLTVFLV